MQVNENGEKEFIDQTKVLLKIDDAMLEILRRVFAKYPKWIKRGNI